MSRQVTLDELELIASNCREAIWAEAQSQGREPKIYLYWTAGGYYSVFNAKNSLDGKLTWAKVVKYPTYDILRSRGYYINEEGNCVKR